MVLGMVVGLVIALPLFPIIMELFLVLFVAHIPIVHVCRRCCLWVQIFSDKAMSCGVVCLNGVGGCGWPISSRSRLVGMAWRVLMKRAPILAVAAEDITFLMI